MRRLTLLWLTLLMVLGAWPVAADDVNDCFSKTNADLAIKGCTAVLGNFGRIGGLGDKRNSPLVAQAYSLRAQAFYKKGRTDDALSDCAQALKAYPGDVGCIMLRSLLLPLRGEQDKVQSDIDRGLQARKGASCADAKARALLSALRPLSLSSKEESHRKLERQVTEYSACIRLEPKNDEAYLDRGQLLKFLGRHDEGDADYKKALEINPDNLDAMNKVMSLAFNSRDYPRALELSERLLKKDPDALNVQEVKALILDGLGRKDEGARLGKLVKAKQSCIRAGNELKGADIDDAVAGCTAVIETPSIDPKWLLGAFELRARARAMKADFAGVVSDDTKALEMYPQLYGRDPPELLYHRGLALFHLARYDDALADFNKVVSKQPQNANAWEYRGRTYAALGNPDTAIADLGRSIELAPKAGTYLSRAAVYEAQKNAAKAIADYSKAIELDPKSDVAYLQRGNLLLDAQKDDAAISDFSKLIELKPSSVEGYAYRARAYIFKNEHQKAVVDFTKAIELNGNYSYAYQFRGRSHYALGANDSAIADFDKLIRLDPKYSEGYYWRGLTLSRKSDYSKALADLDKAIQLAPEEALYYDARHEVFIALQQPAKAIADLSKIVSLGRANANAYNIRAGLYQQTGDYRRSIDDYSKVLEMDPKFAHGMNGRAWAYFKLGEAAKGLSDIQKALELVKDDANYWDTRAHILEALGRKQEAIADFRKALSLQPSLKESKEGLARLGAQ